MFSSNTSCDDCNYFHFALHDELICLRILKQRHTHFDKILAGTIVCLIYNLFCVERSIINCKATSNSYWSMMNHTGHKLLYIG